MRRRGILFKAILLSVLIVVVLTGCQRNPEEGPREIAQTYFDAVKKVRIFLAFCLASFSGEMSLIWDNLLWAPLLLRNIKIMNSRQPV